MPNNRNSTLITISATNWVRTTGGGFTYTLRGISLSFLDLRISCYKYNFVSLFGEIIQLIRISF
jgi:hypothetical protein